MTRALLSEGGRGEGKGGRGDEVGVGMEGGEEEEREDECLHHLVVPPVMQRFSGMRLLSLGCSFTARNVAIQRPVKSGLVGPEAQTCRMAKRPSCCSAGGRGAEKSLRVKHKRNANARARYDRFFRVQLVFQRFYSVVRLVLQLFCKFRSERNACVKR